jgi:hypothetical protein
MVEHGSLYPAAAPAWNGSVVIAAKWGTGGKD